MMPTSPSAGRRIARPNRPPRNAVWRANDLRRPTLRFTAYAWAKLEYWRDCGPTEIGAFGQSAADDLLLIEDLHLVPQTSSVLSVRFDDVAVADYFDRQVDQGLSPARFGRVWIHTHPGHCASPSAVDEATFQRVFGASDWALMFILARGGRAQAWLRFAAGPGTVQRIPIKIDFRLPFAAADQDAWRRQYQQCVQRSPLDLWEQSGPEEVLDLPF